MTIDDFLTRGVENVFPSKGFVKKRMEGKDTLTMYLGIDPTGPTLHLGHIIPLRKMRVFQDLGHKVILLIGDFTGMIGDPSDKSAARKRLTHEEVIENAKRYKEQASKIIRFDGSNPAELKYNNEWLGKMSFADVVELSAHFTVQQMLERDMFDRRVKEQKPIYIHEFLYPLMQGYDSVAMDVDGEIGGNDQTFNMLAGRTLMKEMKKKEKFVLAMKLLTDTAGRKMGKTEGNMITLVDTPDEMFGKIMSWGDGMIASGFELLTDVSAKTVQMSLKKENPRDVKMRLAEEVVKLLHGEKEAVAAREQFVSTFQRHEVPSDVPVKKTDKLGLVAVLVDSGLASSNSEARRLIEEGGIKNNGVKVVDWKALIKFDEDGTALLQRGKRQFIRLVRK